MCEPISISTGAAWALGASAAIAAGGAYMSYNAQKEQGEAAAQMAENNAKLDEQRAQDARAQGDQESQEQSWRTRQILGQQRAAVASQGIASDFGTPVELFGETAMFGEVDQQRIRLNAARSAWGFSARANDSRNQGRLDKWSGRQQANATALSGLSSAVGSVGGFWG